MQMFNPKVVYFHKTCFSIFISEEIIIENTKCTHMYYKNQINFIQIQL